MRDTGMKVARVVYLIAIAAAVLVLVIDRSDELRAAVDGARFGWLIASFIISFGMIGLGGVLWNRAMRGLGHDVSVAAVTLATARSVMARYIPGSVWFAIGRVGILRAAGHDAAALGATALLEIALSLTVAIGIGALILGVEMILPGGLLWVFVAIGLLAVGSSPPVLGPLLAWVARTRGTEVRALSWPAHLTIVGWMIVFWLWSALSFLTYLRAFPSADGFETMTVVGGFMLSWGIGFLAIIAPQGVGVAEASLAAILGSSDLATLALLIGGYRAVILIRDVVATAVGELMRARATPPESASTD